MTKEIPLDIPPRQVGKAFLASILGTLPVALVILIIAAGNASRWNMEVFLHRTLLDTAVYVVPGWLIVSSLVAMIHLGGGVQHAGGSSGSWDDGDSAPSRSINPASGLPTIGGPGTDDIGGNPWGSS